MTHIIFKVLYRSLALVIFWTMRSFPWSARIRQWSLQREQSVFLPIPDLMTGSGIYYLFICASMGEYLAVEMICRQLKKSDPSCRVELSFFSPSGFLGLQGRDHPADAISYTPPDTSAGVSKYFGQRSPNLIIISGHSLWPEFLHGARDRQIPYVFTSFDMRPKGLVRHSYFKLILPYLRSARKIFTITAECHRYLSDYNLDQAECAGNPRVATIMHRAVSKVSLSRLELFTGSRPVVVFGSTHARDEKLLARIVHDLDADFIVIPHDTGEDNIQKVRSRFPRACLYSENTASAGHRIMIVDQPGILADIYRYGDVAFVGGGFDGGVHNIIEPAVHGIPVIFGPRYERFAEATEFIHSGVGYSVRNHKELRKVLGIVLSAAPSPELHKGLERFLQKHQTSHQKIALYLSEVARETSGDQA